MADVSAGAASAIPDGRSGPILLQVDSSPRLGSVTNSLTALYATTWLESHPDGRVIRHDLPALNLPHLNSTEMGAWFTDPAEHTDLHELVLARSNNLIDDVLSAEEIVIGAPMWNFSIPSSLKAWIDHVTKAGRTITFGEHGPRGVVTASRAVVVSGRGSEYRAGTVTESLDMQEPYLRLILGFLGIQDVRVVCVDHQGPNYTDGLETYAAAEAEILAIAAEATAPLA